MALIVVENGKGEGIDVGGDAKTEHQHQKGRAEQRKAEPDPIAYQFQRFANGASSEAPQTEGAAVARRSGCDGLLCCKDSLSCSDKTTRSRRLLEVADECVFERSDATSCDEACGRIGRQHTSRIHQRNPVAACGFV